ncbi:PIF1-like helicase-domain-containing protein, partial [Dipodascopsis tothii]|uniref:PIF1-like helicase-domain-containing protein n=1 Tax=Dipodascopsis tothii TaxID=44089 RepID=UPI0034CE51D7
MRFSSITTTSCIHRRLGTCISWAYRQHQWTQHRDRPAVTETRNFHSMIKASSPIKTELGRPAHPMPGHYPTDVKTVAVSDSMADMLGVEFNEDDLDDDEDLARGVLDGDDGVPWSSSPFDRQKQTLVSLGRVPPDSPPKPASTVLGVLAAVTTNAPAPGGRDEFKKRKLPWAEAPGTQARNFSSTAKPAAAAAMVPLPMETREPREPREQRPSRSREPSHDPPREPRQRTRTKDTEEDVYDRMDSMMRRRTRSSEHQIRRTGDDKEEKVGKASSTRAERRKKNGLATVFLSEEQRMVLKLVTEKGSSVFFTGSAGTGKSVLLREIISALRMKHKRDQDAVAVTASTGLAACNIGGVTLHSFAGIGLGKEAAPELVRKIRKNKKAMQRWLRAKVLIMDEISMVDGALFDKLDQVARIIRNATSRPFGGIQLIVTGDFFQLPPVPEGGRATKFAFDATSWTEAIPLTVCLTHVFRQKDQVFVDMLNEMREGKLSAQSIERFRALARRPEYSDGLEPTELFSTRREVDLANMQRMNALPGEVITYSATDTGLAEPQVRTKLLANLMAPDQIQLKKNCQVMLIKNIDESLVNGSLGRVIGFMNETTYAAYTPLTDRANGMADLFDVHGNI